MLDIKKHRVVLLQILKDIYSDISIGPLLGFKGGTACHLFYNLPRFSVDLDFDLLDLEKERIVFNRVGEILKSYGTIKDKSNKLNTLFFLLSYEHQAHNIKVEISKRNFGSEYEIKNYLGISMLVMRKEDTLANKLVSLMERKNTANRDLLDTGFFLKHNWDLNKNIIELRTKMKVKEYLKKCILFVEKVNKKHILAGMGELLDKKMKVWVKENLKQELLFLLKIRLKNL